MTKSEVTLPWSQILSVSDLPKSKPTFFKVAPEAAAKKAIADYLGLDALPKLTFQGEIAPDGASSWLLRGSIGASVIQPCVATLEPVKTRIDDEVNRFFIRQDVDQELSGETEMPEDVSIETVGDSIDLGKIMVEALGLRIPMFPRAAGGEPVNITVTEPGIAPLTDEDVRPFAQLKNLRDKLQDGSE